MREGDRGDEILDEDSFNGTIEERDENEEPEMQDISFRDLDIGGIISKPATQRNVLDLEEHEIAENKDGTDHLPNPPGEQPQKQMSSEGSSADILQDRVFEISDKTETPGP